MPRYYPKSEPYGAIAELAAPWAIIDRNNGLQIAFFISMPQATSYSGYVWSVRSGQWSSTERKIDVDSVRQRCYKAPQAWMLREVQAATE